MGFKKVSEVGGKLLFQMTCDDCGDYIGTERAESEEDIKKQFASYNERFAQYPSTYYCSGCEKLVCKRHVEIDVVREYYEGYGVDVDYYKMHVGCEAKEWECTCRKEEDDNEQ